MTSLGEIGSGNTIGFDGLRWYCLLLHTVDLLPFALENKRRYMPKACTDCEDDYIAILMPPGIDHQ
jgi:hypothetical protein